MSETRSGSRDASFVGSIPETYDQHLGPLLFAHYARDLAGRVAPLCAASKVLEVAAGTGIFTEQLRATLPDDARLTATDLNAPMLAVAQRRLTNAAPDGKRIPIAWEVVDATTLPFGDSSFDAVVCQFGVMFFPDKPRAASETFRVLRPGGQWLFSVWGSWDENPFARIVHETTSRFFASDPPQFYRVPFGMHDPTVLRELVRGAGFEEPDVVTLEHVTEAPSAMHAAIGLVQGNPLLGAIQERGTIDPDDVTQAVAEALARSFGDHPLRFPTLVRVVNTRRRG